MFAKHLWQIACFTTEFLSRKRLIERILQMQKNGITSFFTLTKNCLLCQQKYRESTLLCHDCSHQLIPYPPGCHQCAAPFSQNTQVDSQQKSTVCEACQQNPPPLHHIVIGYYYTPALRFMIHQFKYHDGLYLTAFLAHLILQRVPQENQRSTECLIPIPMHAKRLRQRGYNQAAELAKVLAKQLKKPCALYQCEKLLHTQTQTQLKATLRTINVANAFQAKPSPYTHVTLIDDLITTGSTAQAVARALKQQGVKRVDLWCCARGIYEG